MKLKSPSQVRKDTDGKLFDIIADKNSKFIIQLDKIFDIDANKQINQINQKKIKTDNPYVKRNSIHNNMGTCKTVQNKRIS